VLAAVRRLNRLELEGGNAEGCPECSGKEDPGLAQSVGACGMVRALQSTGRGMALAGAKGQQEEVMDHIGQDSSLF